MINYKLFDLGGMKLIESNEIDLAKLIIQNKYPEYDLFDYQNKKEGCPDFRLIHKLNKDDYFWIEVKKENDGLRQKQVDWMVKNKNEKIRILFIKGNFKKSTKLKEMEKQFPKEIECESCGTINVCDSLSDFNNLKCKNCGKRIFKNLSKIKESGI